MFFLFEVFEFFHFVLLFLVIYKYNKIISFGIYFLVKYIFTYFLPLMVFFIFILLRLQSKLRPIIKSSGKKVNLL